MAFERPLPIWNAEGIEPPLSKKNEGWQAGDKPPAEWWNWYMYTTYKALEELQEKAGQGSAEDIEYDNETSELAAVNVQAAIDEIHNNQVSHLADYVTTGEKTYFIDAINGNDNNNGLTAGTAFKTWGKCVKFIPTFIKHRVTIKIIGNLPDTINLSGKILSDYVVIEGSTTSPSNHKVSAITVTAIYGGNNAHLTIRNLESNGQITCFGVNGVSIENCNPRNTVGNDGVNVRNSHMRVMNCDFGNDIVGNAILVASSSTVFSSNNTGKARFVGLKCLQASTIGKEGPQPTGTNANELTSTGGVIR